MHLNPDLRKRYAIACRDGSDAIAEQCLDIADDTSGDVARDKLRIDTRKWFNAKAAPTKYGDHASIVLEASVDMTSEALDRKIEQLSIQLQSSTKI